LFFVCPFYLPTDCIDWMYKKAQHKFSLIIIFLFIVGLAPAFTFGVDPFKFFDRDHSDSEVFFKNHSRLHHRGLINNYLCKDDAYDTILMGASVAQNFEPSLLVKSLNQNKALNLSFSGAKPSEQAFIVKEALNCSNIDTVFWTLGPVWKERADVGGVRQKFPDYMHNSKKVDNLNYLFDFKTLIKSVYFLAHIHLPHRFSKHLNINDWEFVTTDHISAWADFSEEEMRRDNEKFQNNTALGEVAENAISTDIKKNHNPAHETETILLAPLFSNFDDVDFKILIPPLYKNFYSPENTRYEIERVQFVAQMQEHFPNVKAYSFPDPEIMLNPINFKDRTHFDVSISRYILRQIGQGKGELTSENIDNHLNVLHTVSRTSNPVISGKKLANIDGQAIE